jgi:formamidopyrimidine-DNA glycosylase
VKGIAERLNGRRLESVDAVGKNLLLRFEGGLVLRSHLRMTGRWRLERRGARRVGKPWLVLRGTEREGVLWNGPVLELGRGEAVRRLGPDVLDEPLELDAIVRNLRSTDSGARSAWRCSTSASSPASGTCGRRRRCGRRASRRGARRRSSRTTSFGRW